MHNSAQFQIDCVVNGHFLNFNCQRMLWQWWSIHAHFTLVNVCRWQSCVRWLSLVEIVVQFVKLVLNVINYANQKCAYAQCQCGRTNKCPHHQSRLNRLNHRTDGICNWCGMIKWKPKLMKIFCFFSKELICLRFSW